MLPIRIIAGVILFLLAALGFVSMVLSQVDTLINSECGIHCGYINDRPELPNPLEMFLIILAPYFPLDAAVVALIVFFFFGATINGLRQIGIRFFWKKVADIKGHKTEPSTIVLLSMLTSFAMLFMTQQLLTMAPGYFSYGSQKYDFDGKERECDLAGPFEDCHITQTAGLIHTATGVTHNFVGIALYYGTWLFLGMWVIFIGIVIHNVRTQGLSIGTDFDGKEQKMEEQAGLLDSESVPVSDSNSIPPQEPEQQPSQVALDDDSLYEVPA